MAKDKKPLRKPLSQRKKKLLPCLRCGKKWLTVPEKRICNKCNKKTSGVRYGSNVIPHKLHREDQWTQI